MIDYEIFLKLYREAHMYSNEDFELYVAERGWEEWMGENDNEYAVNYVRLILTEIFKLSRMTIKEIRSMYYSSRSKFANAYEISPYTIRGWENDTANIMDSTKKFIAYTVFIKRMRELIK